MHTPQMLLSPQLNRSLLIQISFNNPFCVFFARSTISKKNHSIKSINIIFDEVGFDNAQELISIFKRIDEVLGVGPDADDLEELRVDAKLLFDDHQEGTDAAGFVQALIILVDEGLILALAVIVLDTVEIVTLADVDLFVPFASFEDQIGSVIGGLHEGVKRREDRRLTASVQAEEHDKTLLAVGEVDLDLFPTHSGENTFVPAQFQIFNTHSLLTI